MEVLVGVDEDEEVEIVEDSAAGGEGTVEEIAVDSAVDEEGTEEAVVEIVVDSAAGGVVTVEVGQ
jgi:hypothetical protein